MTSDRGFLESAFGGTLTLLQLGTMWTRRWRSDATRQAGIFCYRDLVKEILGGETA